MKNSMSVHLDSDITLALNRLRMQCQEESEKAGLGWDATPTLGWLARSVLRKGLGLNDTAEQKKDNLNDI